MRCFFNVVGSTRTVVDHVGVEVVDLNEAGQQALTVAEELRREEPDIVYGWNDWHLEIVDDRGNLLLIVDLGGVQSGRALSNSVASSQDDHLDASRRNPS